MPFFDWTLTVVKAGNRPNSNFDKVVDGGHAYEEGRKWAILCLTGINTGINTLTRQSTHHELGERRT